MSTEDPRPGSYAALDRRVERIEERQNQQALALSELSAEMRVLHAGQQATSGDLHAVSAKLDRLLDSSASTATMMADPEATAAGRLLLKEIAEAQANAKIAKAAADALALKVSAGAGALAVIVFLVNLFAPLIRQVIGLP